MSIIYFTGRRAQQNRGARIQSGGCASTLSYFDKNLCCQNLKHLLTHTTGEGQELLAPPEIPPRSSFLGHATGNYSVLSNLFVVILLSALLFIFTKTILEAHWVPLQPEIEHLEIHI